MTINTTRRSVIAALPGIAAAIVPPAAMALPAQSADDPIFPLIAEYEALGHKLVKLEGVAPDDEFTAVNMRRWDVVQQLFATTPTTPAGVAAWLRFLGQHDPADRCSLIEVTGHIPQYQQLIARQALALAAVLTGVQA